MIKGAGILFACGEQVLFLRRGNGGDHPNEWALPGGTLEDGENQMQAAIRETEEETGAKVSAVDLAPWTRTLTPAETPELQATEALPINPNEQPAPSQPVDFTTFLVRLNAPFTPKLSDESDGYGWAPISGPPQPLHPAVQVALDRFSMDELGVARAMAQGRLVSPQKYENVDLFAIRITGTGVSYRHNREEFVWRDPKLYINDEFLARCNGLSVIWEHPEKSLLNHDEFKDRIIGSIMLPYVPSEKPNEVWGIAKIYDAEAAKEMSENVLSTSPAVNFADPSENDKIKLEDGKIMLIEGKPSLLDHIAICSNGVWDKGGAPTGVESITAQTDSASSQKISLCNNHKIDILKLGAAAFALRARATNF